MKKIVIFAGTTEGRRLSEILADAGIAHTVCVATEYGEIVMREQTDAEAAGTKGQPLVSLHRGRMDRQQMEEFLRNEGYEIVVDATHPYAQVVTENIRDAVKTQSSIYLRLEREISETPEAENPVVSIRYFESNADCAKALENTEGNILLTTGSKELPTYCASGRLHDRLYVRILPGRESLELCMEQGIKGRQILALQGPFSTEMNAAILKQYDIHHMVTKNSGRTGGYQEKLEAAKILGIPVYVIQPAKKAVDTYSFAEICGKLEQLCDCKLSGQGSMEICLAGIGMGSKDGQTQEVQHAIETADILLGAERMIERYSAKIEKRPYYMTEQILPYLEQLQKNGLTEQKDPLRVTVLFSGDTGFYSGAKKLADILKKDGYEVQIFPGISSVIYLAARVGKSWEDAKIISMHGRSQNFIYAVANHEKTFLILGKSAGKEICEKLKYYHLEQVTVSVGNHLSYPDEEIVIKKGNELQAEDFGDLTTILIENPKPEKRTGIHLADEELIRGSVPMTKEEVRTVSIAKLKLTKNAVIYDVGAGTGSVSIEAALQGENLRVYAIEKNPEGAELIRKNMQKFRTDQIQVIEGVAPEALEALEMPTHAFIGGSTGQLKEIIQCIKKKNPDVRIVINAISLETVKEAMEAMEEGLLADPEIIQLNVAKSKKLGRYHMMTGLNPIYIISDGGDTE